MKKFNVTTENELYKEILQFRKDMISNNTLDPIKILKPITITYDVPHISFNLFGCWNSMNNNTLGTSGKSKNPSFKNAKSLPILSDMINKFKNSLNPTFTVVLGDNFYDENDPNVKRNVDTGFNLLANSEIPYFILFGNHDVKTYEALFYELKKCYDDMTINDFITFGQWIIPGANYLLKINSQNMICYFLMIDTNVFMENFYSGLPNNRTKLKRAILSWIDKTLSSINKISINKTNNIIFATGHHPFYASGHKSKRPLISNDELNDLYNLLIKYNVKFYLCADEHNFQYIYDASHDIHHILSGGASSGDESFTFVHNEKPYDSRGIKLMIKNTELYSKMIINSPHFVHIDINESKIDIKVISLTLNQYHSIDYLRTRCQSVNLVSSDLFQKYYGIVYNLTIPKYFDYIYISNCDEYVKQLENELIRINKMINKSNILSGLSGGKKHDKKKKRVYKLRWDKIENAYK